MEKNEKAFLLKFLRFPLLMAFALILIFTAAKGTAAYAAETGYIETDAEINPVYKNILTEAEQEDILADVEDIAQTSSDDQLQSGNDNDSSFQLESDEVYTDFAQAAAHLKDQMIDREDTLTVIYRMEYDGWSDLSDTEKSTLFINKSHELFDAAIKHTGVSKEGDYLLWNYTGWSMSGSYSSRGTQITLTFNYSITYYTTAEQEAQVDQTLTEVETSLGLSENASDYANISAIYKYITENVSYDYDSSDSLKYTAYAALINHSAVCEGYSVLFYRMALDCGIDARVITGYSNNENHGWNIVNFGPSYYYLDSTWDAQKTNWSYFLIGSSNFLKTHTLATSGDLASTSAELVAQYSIYDTNFKDTDFNGDYNPYGGTGFYNSGNQQIYYYKGTRSHLTGIMDTKASDGNWYYLVDGVVTAGPTVAKNANGWYYVGENGTVDFTYNGFADNANGTWYIQNGKVDFSAEGILQGYYNGTLKWGYVKEGCLQKSAAVIKNDTEWWSVSSDGFAEGAYFSDGNLTDLHITDLATYLKLTEDSTEFGSNLLDSNSQSHNIYINDELVTDLVIPEGTTKIGRSAFYNCVSLKSVHIPSTVTEIGDDVFTGCSNLILYGYHNKALAYAVENNIKFVAMDDHIWNTAYTIDKAATCSAVGSKSIHCSVCDAVKDGSAVAIPTIDHSYGAWTTTKAATCTEKGTKKRTCSVCQNVETAEIAALGHTEAAPVKENVVDATDTQSGSYDEVVYCSVCNKELRRTTYTVGSTGHSWNTYYTVDKPATCTEIGSKSIHCSSCGAIKEGSAVSIPATGHSYGAWTTTKAATCTEKGMKERTCSACGNVETEVILATGHSFTDYVSNNDATCIADGTKTATCDNGCGETKTITDVGSKNTASQHVGGTEIRNAKDATAASAGYTGDTYCLGCGKLLSSGKEIDVLPYGFVEEDGVQIYYVNGIRQTTTNVIKIDGTWYNLVNGVVTPNTVAKNSSGWWYIDENGKVDFSYNGFADNANGTWYCQNGKVNFSANGVLKATYNGTGKWGNVKGGKLQKAETVAKNSAGWWYIGKDGFVDFTANTIARNSSGWWAIFNGKVNFSYNGIATNANGSYKITSGKVTFADNGVLKVGNYWYYLVKSKVTPGPTVQKNSSGWWYIDNTGKVDFTFTGIAANSSGNWYCKGGKVQFSYTGTVTYNGKTYNIVNGKVK